MSERPKIVEVYPDASGHWRWRVRASNGQLVATSGEAFASKQNAVRAVPKEFEDDELLFFGKTS